MADNEVIAKVFQELKIEYTGDPDEELVIHSVQFVSMIVALEQEFDIEIPDEYLIYESLNTYRKIQTMLKKVRN